MTCPGLHCPGCSSGQSAGIAALAAVGLVVADSTMQVVAENIVWISAVVVVCFVLSVTASMWLEQRSGRRCAAWGHERGTYSRADMILPYRCVPMRWPPSQIGQPSLGRRLRSTSSASHLPSRPRSSSRRYPATPSSAMRRNERCSMTPGPAQPRVLTPSGASRTKFRL